MCKVNNKRKLPIATLFNLSASRAHMVKKNNLAKGYRISFVRKPNRSNDNYCASVSRKQKCKQSNFRRSYRYWSHFKHFRWCRFLSVSECYKTENDLRAFRCLLLVLAIATTVDLRQNPYYFFVAALGVHDCGSLAITLAYSGPAIYTQENIGKGNCLE